MTYSIKIYKEGGLLCQLKLAVLQRHLCLDTFLKTFFGCRLLCVSSEAKTGEIQRGDIWQSKFSSSW